LGWELAIVGLALLVLAAVSPRLSSTPVTPAMAMVAIGVIVGPLVLDDVNVGPTSATVRTLAEASSRWGSARPSANASLAPAVRSLPIASVGGQASDGTRADGRDGGTANPRLPPTWLTPDGHLC
jgi:hypothetical protein